MALFSESFVVLNNRANHFMGFYKKYCVDLKAESLMKKFLLFLYCTLLFGFFFGCDPNEGPPEPPDSATKVEITIVANITYFDGWGLHSASIWLHTQDEPISSFGGMVNYGSFGSNPSQVSRKIIFEGEDAEKLIGRQAKGVNYLTFRIGQHQSAARQFDSDPFTIEEGVNPIVIITAVQK